MNSRASIPFSFELFFRGYGQQAVKNFLFLTDVGVKFYRLSADALSLIRPTG